MNHIVQFIFTHSLEILSHYLVGKDMKFVVAALVASKIYFLWLYEFTDSKRRYETPSFL